MKPDSAARNRFIFQRELVKLTAGWPNAPLVPSLLENSYSIALQLAAAGVLSPEVMAPILLPNWVNCSLRMIDARQSRLKRLGPNATERWIELFRGYVAKSTPFWNRWKELSETRQNNIILVMMAKYFGPLTDSQLKTLRRNPEVARDKWLLSGSDREVRFAIDFVINARIPELR